MIIHNVYKYQYTTLASVGEPQEVYMKAEDITPTWLSYSEAQRLVGLGRTTLWQLVSSGEVKAARVGRAVRLNRQSLERYLERQSDDFE